MNVSFQSENNSTENIPEESPKNPYFIKEYVPELQIIEKNIIICDKIKYNIRDYIKKINNTSNEFLDDIMIYNHCGKCKNDLNKYFCKNCFKNICAICYEKCKIEKHDFINLDGLEEKSQFCLTIIKNFLERNIIPMKEYKENSINEENNEDIFLIIEIISLDY